MFQRSAALAALFAAGVGAAYYHRRLSPRKTPFLAREHGDYLIPEAVFYYAEKPTEGKREKINVRCFSNGKWWACPNPYDKRRVTKIQAAYDAGLWRKHKDIPMDADAFSNAENWHSRANNIPKS